MFELTGAGIETKPLTFQDIYTRVIVIYHCLVYTGMA